MSLVSGVPEQHVRERLVRIFVPAKNAMQSGTAHLRGKWRIEFDRREQWENPLMGWTSTGDPLGACVADMDFDSREEAERFVSRNGWSYFVDEPPRLRPKFRTGYADIFSWNKRTRSGFK